MTIADMAGLVDDTDRIGSLARISEYSGGIVSSLSSPQCLGH